MANILQTVNVSVGDELFGASVSNVDGHFEDIELVEINDAALASIGRAWDSPPHSIDEMQNISAEIRQTFEEYSRKRSRSDDTWATKDPRLSLTISVLHPYLSNPFYIICHRNPNAVATSLYKRDQISLETGTKLKEKYDIAIESFLLKNPDIKKFDVEYDELMEKPDEVLHGLFNFLEMQPNQELLQKACGKVRSPQDLRKRKEEHLASKKIAHLKKLENSPLKALSLKFWKQFFELHKEYKRNLKNI